MTETVTIAARGITLDLLLWRRDGDAGAALVEAALDLNPGLAARGAEIPAGVTVVLPDPVAASSPATTTSIDLFA